MSNQIEGKVASIGDNGDLITDISVDQFAQVPTDDSVRIKFGGHETMGIFPADHEATVSSPDSNYYFSIGLVKGSCRIEVQLTSR